MKKTYDHAQIEKKWQEEWAKNNANVADENSTKPKEYVLDMFPYPSGAGLHVGHVEGYTATDIYARFKRMNGSNVLHPMGWDAFGLPAENYAIKTKVHPDITTNQSIDNFRKQIKSLGLSYDWTREIGTHTPEYYKWTQWIFLKFLKQGLAYKKRMADFVRDGPLDCVAPILQQGDMLLWTSMVIHGSLPTMDERWSRRSFTAHYVPVPQPYTGANAWRIPLNPVPAQTPASIKTRFLREIP